MEDEKLVKHRLRLNDARYYMQLLEYIPDDWDYDNILNKKAKELSVLELKRIMMVKKHQANIVLLSLAIQTMTEKRLEKLNIEYSVYTEMMNFEFDELINMKFQDEEAYKSYMACVGYYPENNVLNSGVNIYDNGSSLSSVKGKTHYKKKDNGKIKY